MLPWAGPLGRAASVLDVNVTELWRPLMPVQAIGMVLMLVVAFLLGYREKKRIERQHGAIDVDFLEEVSETEQEKESPKLFWFNSILTVLFIAVLLWGFIPVGLSLIIGISIF